MNRKSGEHLRTTYGNTGSCFNLMRCYQLSSWKDPLWSGVVAPDRALSMG